MINEVITLLCPIHAAPGKGAALKLALQELASNTVQEPGNICYRLHTTDDPDEFIIYEQWKNQSALDFHMATAHLQQFLADEKKLLAAQPAGRFLKEFV